MISNRSVWCAAALLLAGGDLATPRLAHANPASSVDAAIARGDESYGRGALREALAAYQSAAAQDAGHYGVLCGLARVESDLADDARGEERRRLIATSVEHARTAVKVAPENAPGHVCLAVALGRQLQLEGPKTRAALAREIRSELDRALAIEPGNARAYYERGLWNQRLVSRGLWDRAWSRVVFAKPPRGASMDNAVRDLERAVELAPDAIEFRVALGRTYLDLKRYGDARRELTRAVQIPTNRPRDPGLQAQARELLEKLAKRG
jgi:hypothetical protein